MIKIVVIVVVLALVAWIIRKRLSRQEWLCVHSSCAGRFKIYSDCSRNFILIINNSPTPHTLEIFDKSGAVIYKCTIEKNSFISNTQLCKVLERGNYLFTINSIDKTFNQWLYLKTNLSTELNNKNYLRHNNRS